MKCPICLDNMYQAVYMRTIKDCKHTFCGECIEEWLSENKTCPICKSELEVSEVSKVSEVSEVSDLN